MNFYDGFRLAAITAFSSIPDQRFCFVKIYFNSYFFEHLLEDIDLLFNMCLCVYVRVFACIVDTAQISGNLPIRNKKYLIYFPQSLLKYSAFNDPRGFFYNAIQKSGIYSVRTNCSNSSNLWRTSAVCMYISMFPSSCNELGKCQSYS